MTKKSKERLHGMLLVFLASTCWGTTGTLQALAPEGVSTLSMGALRIVMAGSVLLAWCILREGGTGFLRKTSLPALLVGMTGLIGFQFSFFAALRLAGVSIGTMITIGSSPVIAGALGALVIREPLSFRWFLSTLVAISGCALLILGGVSGPAATDPSAIVLATETIAESDRPGFLAASLSFAGPVLLALFASFCYALMGLGLKMQGRRLDTVQATAVTAGASMIVGIPALLLLDPSWIFTARGCVLAFFLGFVTMVFPICFFSMGLRKIFLRDAYTVSLSEPITALLLSALVLGERLAPLSIGGAALILCGILLLPAGREGGDGSLEPTAE